MLGETAGISVDTIDRGVLVAGSSVSYVSTSGSRGGIGSGMRLNTVELLRALRTLERNDARPIQEFGRYAAIVHPDSVADLRQDSTLVNALQYAGPRDGTNPLFDGGLPDYFGIRFFSTSNARIVQSSGLSNADVYITVLLGEGAYATTDLDAQQMRIIYKPATEGGPLNPLENFWSLGTPLCQVAEPKSLLNTWESLHAS